jgi:glycosyltransferase involved in cell wall biosynthesis
VDPNLFDYRPEGAEAARQKLGLDPDVPLLTFVGKLDYLPNVRAVSCIAERIAPAVWQHYPQARFAIVGQGAEALLEYGRDGLIFTGFVDARPAPGPPERLSLCIRRVLVPLDSGSSLKILEAAANARPVVSTRIGAEGQEFIDGEEILLTDAVDEAFVTGTLRLLGDRNLRECLGRAARARVQAQYSWEAQVHKMENLYAEL